MLRQAAGNGRANRVADLALGAPRQVWLAGLGAATVTREWARHDAGHVFRALVKEGSSVEARAIRTIGRRLDSSVVQAATAWNRARNAAQAGFNGLVETAATVFPALKAPRVAKRPARAAARKPRAVAKRAASRKSRRNKRSA